MPKRVLQIVHGMNRGGVETWLLRILRAVDDNQISIDFAVYASESGHYDEEIKSLGARIFKCPDPRRHPLAYAKAFRKIVTDHGPYDFIHSHVYLLSGYILKLASTNCVPGRIAHIYPQIDIKQSGFVRRLYRLWMTRWITRYANRVLFDSKASMAAFKKLCPGSGQPYEVVYPAVDLGQFDRVVDRDGVRSRHSIPKKIPVVVYVARFWPHKNHEQVLRIADRLKTLHFVLAGSHGPMTSSIERLVAERNNVTLLKNLENVTDLLLSSDLFLFPSLNEGFGIVALEAAAAGLPIVATSLDTVSEACPPTHRSFMFPPNDDDAAIKNIQRLLGNRALMLSLSADARTWAAEFSIEKSLQRLSEIYGAI